MNSLALTIYPQENTLNGVIMYEPCDAVVLDKLINSKLLKMTFNNKTATHHYENEKTQLEEYRKLFQEGKAKIHSFSTGDRILTVRWGCFLFAERFGIR